MNPLSDDPGVPPGYYYYLSYAHSAPPSPSPSDEQAAADTDPVIEAFVNDLDRTIRGKARPGKRNIGFLDHRLATGSDIRAGAVEALGSAQVFVPLYSPGYFARSWSLREQAAFRSRMVDAAVDPDSRIVPVLWTPVSHTESNPDVERALRTAGAVAGQEYRENGLRALFLLAAHHGAYEAFRNWLAGEIVAVAENSPLAPSAAPALREVEAANVKEARFLVTMLGPTETPARSKPWWRTYAAPVAQHAANVADRLGLRGEVVTDAADAGPLFERTPGIVLVDPWPADGSPPDSVAEQVAGLPAWVLPVVLEEPQEQAGDHAAAIQAGIAALRAAVQVQVESVSDMVSLDRLLPMLVTKARSRYLRQVRIAGVSGAPKRPRLGDAAE